MSRFACSTVISQTLACSLFFISAKGILLRPCDAEESVLDKVSFKSIENPRWDDLFERAQLARLSSWERGR